MALHSEAHWPPCSGGQLASATQWQPAASGQQPVTKVSGVKVNA